VRIYQHLIDNSILVDEQYVYRINSCTAIATHKLLNSIFSTLNNEKTTVRVIFCDLLRAYDFVNHKIVLAKLEFYGVSGKFLNLIKSYLEDRYQKGSILCNIHSDNISSD
jgi:hypothetical protein